MNRGIIRGIPRKSRSIRKQLVRVPLGGYVSVYDAATTTADIGLFNHPPVGGYRPTNANGLAIPADGSVRALDIILIGRSSVATQGGLYVYDYEYDDVALGGVGGAAGQGFYFGKVANHYDTLVARMLLTGGMDNTQFKVYVNATTTGTTSYWLRISAYWVEAD